MSFTSSTRQRVQPGIPLSGMIDVLFLLLIFFMTTSVFREQERQMDVNLPQASSTAAPAPQRSPIVVTVTADGAIHIGDRAHSLESLRQTLAALAEEYPDDIVVIRGDRQSDLGLAVQVMDVAHEAGLARVSLATTRSGDEI